MNRVKRVVVYGAALLIAAAVVVALRGRSRERMRGQTPRNPLFPVFLTDPETGGKRVFPMRLRMSMLEKIEYSLARMIE